MRHCGASKADLDALRVDLFKKRQDSEDIAYLVWLFS